MIGRLLVFLGIILLTDSIHGQDSSSAITNSDRFSGTHLKNPLQKTKLTKQKQRRSANKMGTAAIGESGIATSDKKQDTVPVSGGAGKIQLIPGVFKNNDTVLIYDRFCKIFRPTMYISGPDVSDKVKIPEKRSQGLRINGSIQYDFLYRSFVDTPFTQHDFQQHTVQASLNIVVKDKYPLKLNLSTRLNNSPYFRNFFDAGFLFDRFTYNRNLKQQLLNKISAVINDRPDLKMLESAIKEEIDRYNSIKTRLNDPDILQRLIEERERQYYKSITLASNPAGAPLDKMEAELKKLNEQLVNRKPYLPVMDSGKLSENGNSYSRFIDNKKNDLDSLRQIIHKLQEKIDSFRNTASKTIADVRQKIYKATSPKELERIAIGHGIADERKKGIESFLTNIKSIGIGRSMISYSELTAWDVSLTGVNLEYNPGIYAAVAAGKIDYGFRDFLGRNSRRGDQTLLLARIGTGDKEKKAIIFSAFTGRKNNYGSVVADTVSGHVNVTGYSVETIWKKDENTGLSAEIAKTTIPISGRLRDNNAAKGLFDFSDNRNLGVSIKGQTVFKETGTRVSGFYRKSGQHFQSFSLFTYNTDQTAWLLKLDQSFLKDKIGIIAMLRRNDFTNPFSEKTFRTNTVFKSFQLNVRFPKWPTLSAGYYPGSQLYIIDKEKIRENAYYILNGSVVHTYSAGGIRMISSVMYNSYSSKGTDTGFIAYKGVSYMVSQSVLFSDLQLQGLFTYTDQEQMQFSTLEANADYKLSSFIRFGGGIKHNKVLNGSTHWGSRAQLGIGLKKIGELQFQFEKYYLPTIYQTLFPVEMGRITWFKYL